MNQEILINVTGKETRVALLEGGLPVEFYLERQGSGSIVGNVYKGKVVRVLPGIQAAFVDIGLEKAGFCTSQTSSSSPKKKRPTNWSSSRKEKGISNPKANRCKKAAPHKAGRRFKTSSRRARKSPSR